MQWQALIWPISICFENTFLTYFSTIARHDRGNETFPFVVFNIAIEIIYCSYSIMNIYLTS